MRSPEVERFISKFCNLENKRHCIPVHSRRILPSVLRNIIYTELPKRDNERELIVRDLTNSDGLEVYFNSNDITLHKDQNGTLNVGVLTPCWSKGLTNLCKNEYIHHEVSWFFHFSQQYVARSRFIEVIGSLALAYHRDTHFRSSSLQLFTISDFGYDLNNVKISAFSNNKLTKDYELSSRRQSEFLYWLNLINGLDPFVHRMLFNYSKAIQLQYAHFDEEAITALDKTINTAEQFIHHRLNRHTEDMRGLLANLCCLTTSEKVLIDEIYKIRCHFGAHPAGSKWWDFPEIFSDDDLSAMFDVTKHLIQKVLLLETSNRSIEKNPVYWSEWFMKNTDILYKSIWFSQYPYV